MRDYNSVYQALADLHRAVQTCSAVRTTDALGRFVVNVEATERFVPGGRRAGSQLRCVLATLAALLPDAEGGCGKTGAAPPPRKEG